MAKPLSDSRQGKAAIEGWYGSLEHTMPELVRTAAQLWPDETFLVGEDGSRLSFAQFESEVAAVARGLIGRGIGFGDRVAIWAPNSVEWILAACGAQSIGAILVPINTRFRGGEAAYVLERTRARALFTVSRFLDADYLAMLRDHLGATPGSAAALPTLETIVFLDGGRGREGALAWSELPDPSVPPALLAEYIGAVAPDATADILFTSGTTGYPKGAMHSHGQGLWMAGIWNRANDLRPGDRMLIVNPFFHSFGYRAGWVSALLGGMTAFPMAVFDTTRLLEMIDRHRISVLMGPPTLFSSLLDHPERGRYDLSSLRVGHTGAANVPVELIVRARDELAFDLFLTSYGLTEATALVSVCTPTDSPETIARTVGRALPGTEIRIDAPARGESGELLVRGPNVMQGYFEDPEATREAIDADGWLHTGDVGAIGPDGTLRIHDRLKDMVIVGGFNVYPAEVEHVLAAHPAIAEVAVIAVPDARLGEVCAACVVLREDAELTLEALTAWARRRLANFKVPRRLFIRQSLPRTPLGKVQKYLLVGELGGEDAAAEPLQARP